MKIKSIRIKAGESIILDYDSQSILYIGIVNIFTLEKCVWSLKFNPNLKMVHGRNLVIVWFCTFKIIISCLYF